MHVRDHTLLHTPQLFISADVILIARTSTESPPQQRYILYTRDNGCLRRWSAIVSGRDIAIQEYNSGSTIRDIIVFGSFDLVAKSLYHSATSPAIAPGVLFQPLEEVEPI